MEALCGLTFPQSLSILCHQAKSGIIIMMMMIKIVINNKCSGFGKNFIKMHFLVLPFHRGHAKHWSPHDNSRSSSWPSIIVLCWKVVLFLSCPLRLSAPVSAVTVLPLAGFPTTFWCLLVLTSGVGKKQQNGHRHRWWIWVNEHWILIAPKGASIWGKNGFIPALLKMTIWPAQSRGCSSFSFPFLLIFLFSNSQGNRKCVLWLSAFLPSPWILFLTRNN